MKTNITISHVKCLLMLCGLSSAGLALSSCEQKSGPEKAAEEVGEAVEEAADEIGDAVEQ